MHPLGTITIGTPSLPHEVVSSFKYYRDSGKRVPKLAELGPQVCPQLLE
jgi:hypothetical protein